MERIRIVNKKGDTKFTLDPIDGKEVTSCATQFNEGLLVITTEDNKYGVVNTKGELVVKPAYQSISDFNEGYALAVNYNTDAEDGDIRYTIINRKGETTPVKGEFGFPSDEGGEITPEFNGGIALVYGKPDTSDDYYIPRMVSISTEGEVSQLKGSVNITMLANGSYITSQYVDTISSYTLKDKEGKILMKSQADQTFQGSGKYVFVSEEKGTVVYTDDGKEIGKIQSEGYVYWPGGKFGPVATDWDSKTYQSTYRLFDSKCAQLQLPALYGVGSRTTIPLVDYEEGDGDWDPTVSSGYVDLTSATSKLVSMISGGVRGKKNYYLGQSVAEILAGDNARYYSGSDRTLYLPPDSTGYLGSGAGFWINGSAHASASIVAPVYQQYFEVHHIDYWGTAWGWNRKRQVGVKFNPSAKVESFDIQLRTNHASGLELRDAVGRRLRKEGYTEVGNTDNYSEFSNGSSSVIIYGTRDSNGVGMIIGDRGSKMSNTQKATLAASL